MASTFDERNLFTCENGPDRLEDAKDYLTAALLTMFTDIKVAAKANGITVDEQTREHLLDYIKNLRDERDQLLSDKALDAAARAQLRGEIESLKSQLVAMRQQLASGKEDQPQ